MSFAAEFNSFAPENLVARALAATPSDAQNSLVKDKLSLNDFACLISPAASAFLPQLSLRSQKLTRQRFGKVVRLFAPLYLSNECVNNCSYCGFSRDNAILRVTLSVEEVLREARALREQGFRNILLVAGEHPKFVSNDYLRDCVAALHAENPSVSLEVGPMETDEYRPLVAAGADGLVVYQETYDRKVYAQVHTAGPKKNFDWRLDTPERAYAAGFRRLGISALYGLADWRYEAISVAAHADYLLRHCWKAQLTISMPRLRPCAGEFQPLTHISDRELAQLICAFRLAFPDVGIVLSTREPAPLRNGLIPLGITLMSAGSHTEPGGYTRRGTEHLHQTVRGRIVPPEFQDGEDRLATGQFEISDDRPPDRIATILRERGFDPVWKDWDQALLG